MFLSPVIGLIFTLVSKSDDQVKFETELLSNAKKQTHGLLKAIDKSFTDELYKLKSLLDSDLITREEFEIEKENLKSTLPQKKTVLSLYCSSTSGISGRLMIRVGDKGNFIDLPQGRDNALDCDVPAGEVKVVISPTGIFASEKMVYLKTVMHETTLYDIAEIYMQW
ncbi:SHOCT domain-containing protein [Sphingobacterium sp. BIGb0116]|uniref:SHOCT domain-containing protein n=1 Tax=Sphingobacterium sp. BIGb0116 TaxID=2940619 RepID=UPI000FBE76F4|nr:SHOCT domain-containing protein [Sphingobacterium sp. BIGb0116]MCS4162969.1 BMFP domain-containing protein YqiC [Sphingobacterium sp. BIGb0116]